MRVTSPQSLWDIDSVNLLTEVAVALSNVPNEWARHSQAQFRVILIILRIPSSVMWRLVTLVRASVSEEYIDSIIRVRRISEVETTLAATSNRSTLRAFFIVIAANTSTVTLFNYTVFRALRSRKLRLTTVGDPPRWPRDTPLSTKVGTKFRREVAVAQLV
jgi:hypothetical protein